MVEKPTVTSKLLENIYTIYRVSEDVYAIKWRINLQKRIEQIQQIKDNCTGKENIWSYKDCCSLAK